MKPWQRSMLRRWGRVTKGLVGIALIAVVAIPLSLGDNPLGRWLSELENPRLAFSLVFVVALALFVGVKVTLERRQRG